MATARRPRCFATWNINGVVRRLPLLLQWLSERRPDVVALQETKCTDADFPHAALQGAGYSALAVGQRTWNGVALLARGHQLVGVRRALPGTEGDGQSRYVEAAVGGVLVASLYLPNGNPQPGPKYHHKLAWFGHLQAHASGLLATGHPVILAGDYNVVPGAADVYRTTSYDDNALLTPAVRAAYAALLAQGWTDALRSVHPDASDLYTFWGHLRNRWPRNAGLRIDHLLLSPGVAARLQDAGVDRELRGREDASDHAPAWIVLRR